MQHRKIEPGLCALEAAAQGLAAAAHPQHRILLVGNQVCDLVHDHDLLGLRGGPPPKIGGAEKLRMQRAAMKADAQDRDAGGHEAPGIFVDRARWGGDAARLADKPFGDGVDRVVGRPLGGRPLDHLSGDDGSALDDDGAAALCLLAHGFARPLQNASQPPPGGPNRPHQVNARDETG